MALATLDYIEQHPEEWKQEYFRCRTGCCFAGHAALLGGAWWAYPEVPESESMQYREGKTIRTMHVARVAAKFLEVVAHDEVFAMLFNSSNTLESLRRSVNWLLPPEENGDE